MLTEITNPLQQVKNRLLSIIHDRYYIETEVLQEFTKLNIEIDVVPNARCGNWYARNPNNIESYFKSTDGHRDHWGFNYRRLNLHIFERLLQLHCRDQLLMIVDSSKYRQVPDSLSKTVPIWCCILSLFVNSDYFIEDGEIDEKKFNKITDFLLVLPLQLENVCQEQAQICKNMINFFKSTNKYLPNLAEKLRSTISKHFNSNFKGEYIKIKSSWIYPGLKPNNGHFIQEDAFDMRKVVVLNLLLCSSSSYSHISRHHGNVKFQKDKVHGKFGYEFDYYQGAGDDHEMWGMNLIDPSTFNENIEKFENIFRCKTQDNTELLCLMEEINDANNSQAKSKTSEHLIDNLNKVYLASNGNIDTELVSKFDIIIIFGDSDIKTSDRIHVFKDMSDDKKGIRNFFKNIDVIERIMASKTPEESILFASEKFDLNIACLLIYFMKYSKNPKYSQTQWNKVNIRQLYLKILEDINTETKTSRLVLNSVNSYIISKN